MRIKLKMSLFTVFIILFVVIGIFYIPVKHAIKVEDINNKETYIVVEVQKSTIAPWRITDSNTSHQNYIEDVMLEGNEPRGFNLGVETGENKYICYGEKNNERSLNADEKYQVFNVESWNIIFPVKRKSILQKILPKGYLCLYDYCN